VIAASLCLLFLSSFVRSAELAASTIVHPPAADEQARYSEALAPLIAVSSSSAITVSSSAAIAQNRPKFASNGSPPYTDATIGLPLKEY
jgi:hypothetical protein